MYDSAPCGAKVLFNERFFNTLAELLQLAAQEILICTFKLQMPSTSRPGRLKKFYDMLIRAQKKGVSIKIVTNLQTGKKLSAYYNNRTKIFLQKNNIEVRGFTGQRILHAKYILIDKKYLLLGSHNITEKAFSQNYEISVLLTDSLAIEIIYSSFTRLWRELSLASR